MGLLSNICKANEIRIIGKSTMEKAGAEAPDFCKGFLNGGALKLKRKYILFDDRAQKSEQEFVVAHELAHHLFGHVNGHPEIATETMELEANIFAAVFVALKLFKEYDSRQP